MPTLTLFDQSHLDRLFRDSTVRADALRALASLQGLANRSRPRLYLLGTRERLTPAAVDVDRFWLNLELGPGGFLQGWRVREADDYWELLSGFVRRASGVVLWDEEVPSTANVAATAAGVLGLIPIRGGGRPGSFWRRFRRRFPDLPVRLDLRGLFTGEGTIPGTHRPSSGSAKCDAYLWAVETFLRSGKCDPHWMAYFPDGMAWGGRPPYDAPGTPAYPDLQALNLANHDFFVARKAFFFDLSPWGDEAPNDDPDQPLGTDLATLKTILEAANDRLDRAGDRGLITVGGFLPWRIKYAAYEDEGVIGRNSKHHGVLGEWEMVAVCSAWNAVLDADAYSLDAMANGSVWAHGDVDPSAFRKAAAAPGRIDVERRSYVCFYVGDFDSAAWMSQTLPRLWEDPGRGRLPMSWAFNPILARRAPHVFRHVAATRTPLDTFTAGDGAGYVNPVHLESPRRHSTRPTELDRYVRFAREHHRRLSMSITGFIINGEEYSLSPAVRRALARVTPDGVGVYRQKPKLLLEGRTPFVECDASFGHRTSVRELAERIGSDVARDRGTKFHLYRTVLVPPTILAEAVGELRARFPGKVEVVDAAHFYGAARAFLEGRGSAR